MEAQRRVLRQEGDVRREAGFSWLKIKNDAKETLSEHTRTHNTPNFTAPKRANKGAKEQTRTHTEDSIRARRDAN